MAGACPDTRANNYAVSSLNIVNKCGDGITATDTATCNDVINKGAQSTSLAGRLSFPAAHRRTHAHLHAEASQKCCRAPVFPISYGLQRACSGAPVVQQGIAYIDICIYNVVCACRAPKP